MLGKAMDLANLRARENVDGIAVEMGGRSLAFLMGTLAP
jgi:hypothetical protein